MSSENSEKHDKCIFCKVANEKEETELLYNDEEVVVFRDHKPAAPHHYLIVPKQHIKDTKQLKKEHVGLVEKLTQIGKQVLEEHGGQLEQARLGYHWPPFTLVNHLHLHVISPVSSMGFMSRFMFRANSYWFVSDEWILDNLSKLPDGQFHEK